MQNRLHQDQDYPCEVVGSWNTWYGEQDQAGKQQCNCKPKTWWKDDEKHHLLLITVTVCAEDWIQGLMDHTTSFEWLQFSCKLFGRASQKNNVQTLPDDSPPTTLLLHMIIYSLLYTLRAFRDSKWSEGDGGTVLRVVWVASVPTQCYSDICCCVSAVHLWRYRGGYPALTECLQKLNNNKVELFLNLFLATEKADI